MKTEQQAAEAMLNKGIKVRVTAPLLLRLIGIKKLRPVVRQPYYGTMLRISLLFLESDLTIEQLDRLDEMDVHVLYKNHTHMLANIMAQALLNGRRSGRLFGKLLGRYLVWHCNPIEMMTIARIMVGLNSKQAFTNTIRLVAAMKMTAPNLSQEAQGS